MDPLADPVAEQLPPAGPSRPQLVGIKPGQQRDEKGRLTKRKKVLTKDRQGELEAMERVLTTPDTDDESYQHVELRKWLESDRRGFMMRLEKARDRKPEQAVKDETGEKTLGVIERLLAEWEQGGG